LVFLLSPSNPSLTCSYDEAVVRFGTLREEPLDAVLVHLMMLHALLDRQPLRESLVAKSFLLKYIQRNPV
jgi:hypothetical protein